MRSLYIHIPFCEKKCLFCSFVVSIGQEHKINTYIDCLEKEALFFKDADVDIIYIGGGTPSKLNEKQLTRLLNIVRKNFRYKPAIEMTIEANPEDIDPGKAKFLASLGFSRISLGIQSLDDKFLKVLGRCHDSVTALQAYENLRSAGCNNINLDLIYSLPDQTLEDLERDVRAISSLKSEHLSLYSLMVEENSRFYAQKIKLNEDKFQEESYIMVSELLQQAGFDQYEVSNFAQAGKESRHNVNYWVGGDYIGLGVGAHSHQSGRRSWNVSRLTDYIKRLERGESAEDGFEILTLEEQFMERILLGLRMNKGVQLKVIEKEMKCRLDDQKAVKIQEFIQGGYLYWDGDHLKANTQGRLVLDELCTQLI